MEYYLAVKENDPLRMPGALFFVSCRAIALNIKFIALYSHSKPLHLMGDRRRRIFTVSMCPLSLVSLTLSSSISMVHWNVARPGLRQNQTLLGNREEEIRELDCGPLLPSSRWANSPCHSAQATGGRDAHHFVLDARGGWRQQEQQHREKFLCRTLFAATSSFTYPGAT